MSMERLERLKKMLEGCDQAHVVASFTSLSPDEQKELLDDIEASDWWPSLQGILASSMSQGPSGPLHAEPVKNVTRLDDPSIDRESWYKRGLELIAEGKVGVLLLAGGQGTRLGSLGPKGCYDIGLPSHKSLFQLQAERISKVKGLAGDQKSLPWYIMTSQFTHKETIDHFEALNYFNLPKEDVVFFQQGFLPCLTEQGKIIMETPSKMAKAPDGNGGVYLSIERSGCLADMKKRGIECLDVYCIDNALARVCDPSFIGYCSSHGGGRGTEVGARVVAKAYPEERVGVFATLTGDLGLRVLEYSELDPSLATAPDPTLPGSLLFNWANICMHYFSIEWLERVCAHLKLGGTPYHVARKKIPSKDGPIQGIKLELFIFDTFHLADPGKTALLQVEREGEFAPVKNAPGSATDSPDTARAALMALHRLWVEAAGGSVTGPEGEGGVEISPLVTYKGEGLEERCRGKSFAPNSHIEP